MSHPSARLMLAASAFLLPLLAVLAFLAAAPAAAASLVSAVPCDTPSLISAISNAVIAGGTRSITLSTGCTYTLTAVDNGTQVDTNGLPLITHTVNLTINGAGATILRDASALRFRLFQVAAGASLTIADLTLSGGHTPDGVSASSGKGGYGGAILNSGGSVTVTHSLIQGSSTGNGGNCCSSQTSGFGGFGGGIYNDNGTVYVTFSKIAGNSTGHGGSTGGGTGGAGGGLASITGTVSVANSTVSGNSTGYGNGIFQIGGPGGGIYVEGGPLNVTNSTIAGNSTGDNFSTLITDIGIGAGIYVSDGALTVTNSTIANNRVGANGRVGGYVAVNSRAVLKNTLVAANTDQNCGGFTSTTGTHNMVDSNDCGATFTQVTPAQLNLGPLQNNGGPTLTLALRFPSAAIDAGDAAACPATDQRGMPRPHGRGCDIGAYEFETTLNYLFLPLVNR